MNFDNSKPWLFKSRGSKNKIANNVVNIIVNDFLDRRGLRQELEGIDQEILNELYNEVTKKVADYLLTIK